MEKNSFKELEALYIKDRGNNSDQTRHKIESNIHLFAFVSNIIDVYLPKAGNVIQSLGSITHFRKSEDKSDNIG